MSKNYDMIATVDIDIASPIVDDTSFILCFEVLKINFSGFFKKLGAQFGGLQGFTAKGTPRSKNGEN